MPCEPKMATERVYLRIGDMEYDVTEYAGDATTWFNEFHANAPTGEQGAPMRATRMPPTPMWGAPNSSAPAGQSGSFAQLHTDLERLESESGDLRRAASQPPTPQTSPNLSPHANELDGIAEHPGGDDDGLVEDQATADATDDRPSDARFRISERCARLVRGCGHRAEPARGRYGPSPGLHWRSAIL